eukprot:COSAG02_NODE_19336_length_887_cov_0.936548_1_plen_72_part_10
MGTRARRSVARLMVFGCQEGCPRHRMRGNLYTMPSVSGRRKSHNFRNPALWPFPAQGLGCGGKDQTAEATPS